MTQDVISNVPFTDEWAQIDSLLAEGLPQSAKTKLLQLGDQLQEATDGQAVYPHQIKLQLYDIHISAQLEEQGDWNAIRVLEKRTSQSTGAAKAIYSSYLAEKYFTYSRSHYRELANRTQEAEATPGEDETSWSLGDLLQRVTELYLQSMAAGNLRDASLKQLSPLIYSGENGIERRPTVYDILLHRALDHFHVNDAFLGEPDYDASFDQLELLGSVAAFVNFKLPATERVSSTQRTIALLQDALEWSNNTRPNSLAHADLNLRRLQFIYDYLQAPGKEDVYEDALNRLTREYRGKQSEALVLVKLMEFKRQRANYYSEDKPDPDDLRWMLREAYAIAADIVDRFPKTYSAQQANNLIYELETPSINLSVEAVQLPSNPGLVLVSYNQVEKVFLKVIPISIDEYRERDRGDDKLQKILAHKATQVWQTQLPQAGDYRSHSTETSFDGLPFGVYALVASSQEDFSLTQGATAFNYFWVSELGLLTNGNYRGGNELMVVNRTTGAPQAGVTINVWSDGNYNQQPKQIVESLTTDANGQAVATPQGRAYASLELIKGKDRLFPNEIISLNARSREVKPQPYTHFFTDRLLYRPGQTVHFKLLALKNDHRVPELLPHTDVTVSLFDVNRQQIASIDLRTNRFGSASGSFTLPSSGLLGNMSIRSSLGGSSRTVKMEEYKRPRFEAKLDELTDAVQLGDEVQIRGSANAYAGPAIAEAEVVYTVRRSNFFPWMSWEYSRYFPAYSDRQETVSTGTTTTDDEGNFVFTFEALPDAALNAPNLRQYRFHIAVDVIDGTGETRSSKKVINLAKYPVKLDLQLKNKPNRGEELQLSTNCENLDNQPIERELQVVIEQLDAPKQTFVKRYWAHPDLPTMKEQAFQKRFPLFSYHKQTNPLQWLASEQRWQKTFQSTGTDSLNISTSDWPVGHYMVSLFTITPEGDTLIKKKHFILHDWNKNEFASGDWLYTRQEEETVLPGTDVKVDFGFQTSPLHLYTVRSSIQEKTKGNWHNSNPGTLYQSSINENDRGRVGLHTTYVLHNRFYTEFNTWLVPWSNKELDITYESFRSKLYPDAKESWTIRIDGPNKEQLATELLASMYDVSLDQIQPFSWQGLNYPTQLLTSERWQARYFKDEQLWLNFRFREGTSGGLNLKYPSLYTINSYYNTPYAYSTRTAGGRGQHDMNPQAVMRASAQSAESGMVADSASNKEAAAGGLLGGEGTPGGAEPTNEQNNDAPPPLKIRTNLSETAFFFPHLMTDAEGRVVLKFRVPESLTRWKLQLFAHTENLAFALDQQEVVTQKELMILPNAPRFLREGDKIRFTAKVSNLSEQVLNGEASLELFDLNTQSDLNKVYQLSAEEATFELAVGASQTMSWNIEVPRDAAGLIGYRVVARAGNFSDGEESALPVLTNRILLTEAMPLFVRPGQSKTFDLQNLQTASANTQHQAFQLDITSNPAWEAIKALPYLQEYPYDCTEQIMNRYYANSLAMKVVEDYPNIREVFDSWKQTETALQSPLLTNQSLKTAVLEETPWVQDAQEESLQRQQVATLFETDRLNGELASIERKILERQDGSGGFSWFNGGRPNWYITQYVVEQFAHLRELGAQNTSTALQNASEKAVRFCDGKAQEWYDDHDLAKSDATDLVPSPIIVHYLYMRSLNPAVGFAEKNTAMYSFCWAIAEKNWMKTPLYSQALLALAAKYSERTELADRIYASLRERSLQSEELGRYWKYPVGYYWYQLPIETHVKLMEVYRGMGASEEELTDLKIWLLRNKETNRWETTKATAAAVHGLVSSGENWLAQTAPLVVSFPKLSAYDYAGPLTEAQANAEAGTGSYQVRWAGAAVKPEMGRLQLKNRSKVPGWGALYWQHFATIDEVKRTDENPLKIERQLYRKTDEGQGDVLQALETAPQVGDLITVRLIMRADRDMEFVHLKDLRASGLEPIDQVSGYRYQSALGYYQQTTDLGTHFFFDYLPKGEYVLEYELRVFHQGDFSGGLATLQCMYAPKFVSHSEGRRLTTEKR